MNELIKIRDVSTQYDISARTLRYYEDMGLITSTRNDDYAYRLYDETAVKKLEQILILRKLNISVKDIKRIFDTEGSSVVLEVLDKKVGDIDGEVALLQELKEIILEFIKHIKQTDFSKDIDIKLLYEKAKEIEAQLVNVDYNGNSANINRENLYFSRSTMIKGFGGMIISSKEPKALAKFYNEKLGMPILNEYGDGGVVELGFNKSETIIWIADENKYEKVGAVWFVLRCNDIDKTYEELKRKGVQLDPPEVAVDGIKELVCKDLEGNVIIIQEQ